MKNISKNRVQLSNIYLFVDEMFLINISVINQRYCIDNFHHQFTNKAVEIVEKAYGLQNINIICGTFSMVGKNEANPLTGSTLIQKN